MTPSMVCVCVCRLIERMFNSGTHRIHDLMLKADLYECVCMCERERECARARAFSFVNAWCCCSITSSERPSAVGEIDSLNGWLVDWSID
jgi:hypothetical protein